MWFKTIRVQKQLIRKCFGKSNIRFHIIISQSISFFLLLGFRRWCASRWAFKYLHENSNESGVIARCVHCLARLNRPNDTEMQNHYLSCTGRRQGSNKNRIRKRAHIEYAAQNCVSPMEINAQKKRFETMAGFRTTYITKSNQIKRYAECRMCKTIVHPVFSQRVIHL